MLKIRWALAAALLGFGGLSAASDAGQRHSTFVSVQGLAPLVITKVDNDGSNGLCLTFTSAGEQPITDIHVVFSGYFNLAKGRRSGRDYGEDLRGWFSPGVEIKNQCVPVGVGGMTYDVIARIDKITFADGTSVTRPMLVTPPADATAALQAAVDAAAVSPALPMPSPVPAASPSAGSQAL